MLLLLAFKSSRISNASNARFMMASSFLFVVGSVGVGAILSSFVDIYMYMYMYMYTRGRWVVRYVFYTI